MKFLTAILTSRDVKKCERTVLSIPDSADILIVVNSMNAGHEYDIRDSEICNKHKIISTKSNGSPGTGKNSVLKYFCDTAYDRLILIDGDDFFLPDGHELLVNTIKDNPDIDILGLQGEVVLLNNKTTYWKGSEGLDVKAMLDTAQVKSPNEITNTLQFIASTTPLVYKNGWTFHRFIVYNKKSAAMVKFSPVLTFEDIIASCDVQLMHDKKQLNFTLFESRNVYVYDRTDIEGVSTTMLKENDTFHMGLFFENYKEHELSKFPEIVLPCLYDMRHITDEQRQKTVFDYIEKF